MVTRQGPKPVATVIGIDPGLGGAIAILDRATSHVYVLCRMPTIGTGHAGKKRLLDLPAVLAAFATAPGAPVFLEKVNASPQMGVVSAFKFGRTLGALEAAATACGHAVTLVPPAVWHRDVCAGAEGADAKHRALVSVRRLFPNQTCIPPGCTVPHDGLVDALLIAEYGRRRLLGRL